MLDTSPIQAKPGLGLSWRLFVGSQSLLAGTLKVRVMSLSVCRLMTGLPPRHGLGAQGVAPGSLGHKDALQVALIASIRSRLPGCRR